MTLQRCSTLPESELAPFHHVQGVSHREFHAYLAENPKPDVRDLVKERDWRLRNGYTSPSRTLTLVNDVTRVETVFSERSVLVEGAADGTFALQNNEMKFTALIPPKAPSSFYIAGGNWSTGKGYLAEIVYTVSVCVVGDRSAFDDGSTVSAQQQQEGLPAVLGPNEFVVASAKRHFLVNQREGFGGVAAAGGMSGMTDNQSSTHGSTPTPLTPTPSGPKMTSARQFLTGGETKATVSLNRPSIKPGDDTLVVRTEMNCLSSTPVTSMTIHTTCTLHITAHGEMFKKIFEVEPKFFSGFPGGYFGERSHLFQTPPGWPATTSGLSVKCAYGIRTSFAFPGLTKALVLDVPVTVVATSGMYASARPAGAPWTGSDEQLSPSQQLPPAKLFRAPWADDAASPSCFGCRSPFTLFNRRHHCRHCGFIFCTKCSSNKVFLPNLGFQQPQRVCRGCHDAAYRTGGAFAPAEERHAYAAAQTAAGVRNAQMFGGGGGVQQQGMIRSSGHALHPNAPYLAGNETQGVYGSPLVNGAVPKRGELREVRKSEDAGSAPRAYEPVALPEPVVPVQDLRSFMQGGGSGDGTSIGANQV